MSLPLKVKTVKIMNRRVNGWFYYHFPHQDLRKKTNLSRNRYTGCFPNKTEAVNSGTSVHPIFPKTQQKVVSVCREKIYLITSIQKPNSTYEGMRTDMLPEGAQQGPVRQDCLT